MVTEPRSIAVHWSSKEQEHLTPARVLQAVGAFWPDGIDLDPCAEGTEPGATMPAAGWTVPARVHWTIADNGLMLPWCYERVYVNPPYNRMRQWVDKAIAEVDSLWRPAVILLCPARPGSQWWKRLRDYWRCELDGRLQFGAAGDKWAAPFPSALFYIGADTGERQRFADVFGAVGDIFRRVST